MNVLMRGLVELAERLEELLWPATAGAALRLVDHVEGLTRRAEEDEGEFRTRAP